MNTFCNLYYFDVMIIVGLNSCIQKKKITHNILYLSVNLLACRLQKL